VKTPVVLFLFNRPECTRQVFAAIRQVRPRQLLLVADGPRPTHCEDPLLCEQARAIVSAPDWPCEVLTDFASTNLGCGQRMVSGLDWVFAQVEEAILLEDDCLPDLSFFAYCEALLHHYREDPRVMHIGGHNRLIAWMPDASSYHATFQYGSVWGWATWRTAWQCFRRDAPNWRRLAHQLTTTQVGWNGDTQAEFLHPFQTFSMEKLADDWCIIWTLSKMLKGGLSLFPARNLISNIGFGPQATHTSMSHALLFQNTPRFSLEFPLHHPSHLQLDAHYEAQHLRWMQCRPSPDLLQPLLDHLLAQNRYVHALVLIEQVLRSSLPAPEYEQRKAAVLRQLRGG
jgi:hypothetical protein